MERTWTADTAGKIGERVSVSGWADSVRAHGKILFIDLRDKSGLVQAVCTPKNAEVYEKAKRVRPSWVLRMEGEVKKRPENMENPDAATGSVELAVDELVVYSESKTLPFQIDTEGYEIDEEKRLKWRYVDLRRERMRRNIEMRHKIISHMREFLIGEQFVEVETPLLTKSTPEGARDFLVPSRLEPGKFYALPQSPQQYKQLLQVAGFERYFQIARCLRDEDPRADRQAEFTQMDVEASFMSQEELLDMIERLFTSLVKKLFPEKKLTSSPFPRLTYKEAMERYGNDKPDLRENKEDPNELAFAFVVDFPMFEWREKEKRWDAVHHPFTLPKTESVEEMKKDPERVLSFQHDLVLNGYEVGGGSMRSYRPEILEAVFEIMGHTREQAKEKFSHLFEAFEYGVPPHGGIAPGIDRVVAVLLGEPSIREVIAFPKTGDNRDLMMDVPSEVSQEQLEELSLQLKKKK